jgi:tetratricopeptide (TPR) repeat protein
MRKISVLLVLFLIISVSIFADYKSDYEKLLTDNELDELVQLLSEWEKNDKNNPELYIAYFNYYLKKGMHSGVSIDTYLKDPKNELALRDPKTNQVVGYINDGTWYEKEDCEKGLEYLNKGIKIAPNRLDMHFGQIHILGQIGEYHRESDKIIQVLNISKSNNNHWLWSNNEPINENGEEILLSSINDYYGLWIRLKTVDSLIAAELTSKEQIKLYPDNIYGYNILGVVNGVQGKTEEALSWYLKAEKVNNQDYIVLNNIAYCYEQLSNNKKAIEYYQKMELIDDDQVKEYARQKISQMNE